MVIRDGPLSLTRDGKKNKKNKKTTMPHSVFSLNCNEKVMSGQMVVFLSKQLRYQVWRFKGGSNMYFQKKNYYLLCGGDVSQHV